VSDLVVIDTSVLIARETGRHIGVAELPPRMVLSVITLAELRSGVLAAKDTDTRDRRLRTLVSALDWGFIPVSEETANQWAVLRSRLIDAGERMDVNDAWIAATAMSLTAPVLTQDDGFPDGIEGLEIIRV